MHTRTALAAVLLALAAVTGCSSSDKADPDACKAAMEAQYEKTAAGDNSPADRPDACQGIDDKTAQKLMGEIMEDQIGKAVGDATAQP